MPHAVQKCAARISPQDQQASDASLALSTGIAVLAEFVILFTAKIPKPKKTLPAIELVAGLTQGARPGLGLSRRNANPAGEGARRSTISQKTNFAPN